MIARRENDYLLLRSNLWCYCFQMKNKSRNAKNIQSVQRH